MSAAQYLARLGVQAQGGVYTLSDSFQTRHFAYRGARVYLNAGIPLRTKELKALLRPEQNLNVEGLSRGDIWTPLGLFRFFVTAHPQLLDDPAPHPSHAYGLYIVGGQDRPLAHASYSTVTARRGYGQSATLITRRDGQSGIYPTASFAREVQHLIDDIWNAVVTAPLKQNLRQQLWESEYTERQQALKQALTWQESWARAVKELEHELI